ncbi:MAG: methyl-accepting chemotaxis protein [Planctomycetaceae bacterium]|nr:methyl-accepting chemotaxis protein [Planctomycetaceae bacterium]
MKLFPKIIGIGIAGLVIAAFIAIVAIYSSAQLKSAQDDMDRNMEFRSKLTAAKEAHLMWRLSINASIVNADEALTIGRDGKLCNFGQWYYSEEANELVGHMPDNVQQLFRDLAPGHLKVHVVGGKLIDMWDNSDLGPSIAFFLSDVVPQVDAFLGELQGLRTAINEHTHTLHMRVESLVRFQRYAIWSSLVFGAIILFLYSWFTAHSIVVPLRQGVDIFHVITQKGSIDVTIPQKMLRRRDEIGDFGRGLEHVLHDYNAIAVTAEQLSSGNWHITVQVKGPEDMMNQNFSKMLDQINAALREIDDNVKQVATGSNEVSSAAQSLSSGAQEAAASLEEISATMQEISSQTKANAESAGQARDLARTASKAATDGQGAMQAMTESMKRITSNSNEIQRVIKVIDDIAFQTNLLALNAAVEAARAGQHGKGFAVVAEEVRNLASRSAKAAQETSELIAKSGQEIEKGDDIATRTASVLNTIVDQIQQTTELVAGIAAASDEQAQGVNQVSQGLQQIDAVTQQNTAAAEESASVANEMNSMAGNLQKLVAQFKLR